MSLFARTIRRFLEKKGYALSRLDAGFPDTLATYLASLSGRGLVRPKAVLLDSNPEALKAFFEVFDQGQIVLSAPSAELKEGESAVVEMSAESLGPLVSPAASSFLGRAVVIVVRAKLCQFASGEVDILSLTERMENHRYVLHDVLQSASTTVGRASVENVFLAYERKGLGWADGPRSAGQRAYAIAEAANHLSVPIVSKAHLCLLAGRGSHGFEAGLCNPGAIQTGGGISLLARGEHSPWPVQKASLASFEASCRPVLLHLEEHQCVKSAAEACFEGGFPSRPSRCEDFRLFEHQGRVYSNHTLLQTNAPAAGGSLNPEHFQASVGISCVDIENSILTPLGSPALDRPTGKTEKNWAMFSEGGRVNLIYSFAPYCLFASASFPSLDFKCAVERRLELPVRDDGLSFRNSINPVPYDSGHLLHIVHKAYPGKRYVFWAVLLDRQTLLPTKMTARPLLRAGASADASIIYACSAISRAGDVLVFAGLDDCSIGSWSISRQELDRHWAPIH